MKRKTMSFLLILVGAIIIVSPMLTKMQTVDGIEPYYEINGLIVNSGDNVTLFDFDLALKYHDAKAEDITSIQCLFGADLGNQAQTIIIGLNKSSETEWIGSVLLPTYGEYMMVSLTYYSPGSTPFLYAFNATLNIQEPLATVGSVQGTVRDKEGVTIPDVKVTVGGRSALTSESGVYLIEDLSPGSYTVTAEKEGWQTYSGTVTVTVGETAIHDITLQPSSMLSLNTTLIGAGVIVLGAILLFQKDKKGDQQ